MLRGHRDAGRLAQLTQTWVDTDGEHVVVNIVQGMQKARNLERDPRVTLAVSPPTAPSNYYQVRGTVVELTSEGGAGSIEALSHKYTGGPYAWYGGRDQVRLIVKVEAEHSAACRSQFGCLEAVLGKRRFMTSPLLPASAGRQGRAQRLARSWPDEAFRTGPRVRPAMRVPVACYC